RRAARDDREWRLCACEPRDGLGEGAIPTDHADGAVAELGRLARKLGRMPAALCHAEVEVCAASREAAADLADEPVQGVRTGSRSEKYEGATGIRAGRTSSNLRRHGARRRGAPRAPARGPRAAPP